MVGFEITTEKNHGLPTTPFVKVLVAGVLVGLTTCKRLTNSLPKLSPINTCPSFVSRVEISLRQKNKMCVSGAEGGRYEQLKRASRDLASRLGRFALVLVATTH